MTGSTTAWRAEIISDAAGLARIAPAWDALWQAAAPLRPSPALRHGYIGLGLRHASGDAAPVIVLVWQAEQLRLAWPLAIRTIGGMRVARHIGGGSDEEYAGPLVDGSVGVAGAVAAALAVLRGAADALWVFNMAAHGPVAVALADAGLARVGQPISSPVVQCGNFADLAGWRRTLSKNLRATLGNDRRRLERLGRFESVIVGPADAAAFCDWFFATKCQWLDQRGIGENWLRRSECRAFYADAIRDSTATGVFGAALTLDGHWIAGNICLDSDPIELVATTFDRQYRRYGPGSLVYEDVVAHGIASGRNVDLRITWENYKGRWTNADEPRTTLLLALTPRGLPMVWRQALRLQVKALRRRLGALKRRWRR